MPPPMILDPTTIDCNRVVVDIEGIRQINPHRFHMELLTAIVHLDWENDIIVGYKDIGNDEFWVSGHMPGYPLFPGVLMCEAAAQLAALYTVKKGVLTGLLGLAGMEGARFRAPVRPGDRLLLVGKGIRVDRRQTRFNVQGFVGSTMAFHVEIHGIPIPGPTQPIPQATVEARG